VKIIILAPLIVAMMRRVDANMIIGIVILIMPVMTLDVIQRRVDAGRMKKPVTMGMLVLLILVTR